MKVFHNPDIDQINFIDERYYQDPVTKLYYPSLTFVLSYMPTSYGLKQWYKQNGHDADRILQEAGRQGSIVHNGIEQLLKGIPLKWDIITDEFAEVQRASYTEAEWYMLLRFKEFCEEFTPDWIASEFKMVSQRIGIGGTLDAVCVINGETWLIDHKTSNYIWDSHWVQILTYFRMWNWLVPEEFRAVRFGILHLCSDHRGPRKGYIQGKGWVLKEMPTKKGETQDQAISRYWNMFYSAKRYFDNEHARYNADGKKYYQPKNKSVPSVIELPKIETKIQSIIK